jgi:hypothetical protein
MIAGGKGGAETNKHGLWFEFNTDLEKILKNLGYEVKEIPPAKRGVKTKAYAVSKSGKRIGILLSKSRLYEVLKKLADENSISWSNPLSANLEPDTAFLNLETRTLHILEKKAMKVSGSVDEKLQTFPYKIRQYRKLLDGLQIDSQEINVHFAYILSFWFQRPGYSDVLEYMREHNVEYWIQESEEDWSLPISIMGL